MTSIDGVYTRAGAITDAYADAPSGLVGTLGLQIVDSNGATLLARTTDGIVELVAGRGQYRGRFVAPDIPGTHQLIWDTGGVDPVSRSEPLHVGDARPPGGEVSWIPEIQDVGAVLRARTRSDVTGGEIGTFDESTRPTGVEVEDFIDHAVAEMQLRLGADLPDRLLPFAQRLAAIRAAMSVELSYDPDRAEGEDSAYGRLRELFDQGMTALDRAVGQEDEPGVAFGSIRLRSVMTVDPVTGEPFPSLLP